MTEPTHPRPVDASELGFERIAYEKAPPRATIRLNRPDDARARFTASLQLKPGFAPAQKALADLDAQPPAKP